MNFGQALAQMVSALSLSALEQPGVTYDVQVGDEFLNANGAPPRIVIVPSTTQPTGPRLQSTNGARALVGETHGFSAELWAKGPNGDASKAKDYVAVTTMRSVLVQVLRAQFGTNFQLGPGQWGEVAGESLETDGRSFIQQFTIAGLTLDALPTQATVLHTTTNIGLSEPGEDFTAP